MKAIEQSWGEYRKLRTRIEDIVAKCYLDGKRVPYQCMIFMLRKEPYRQYFPPYKQEKRMQEWLTRAIERCTYVLNNQDAKP